MTAAHQTTVSTAERAQWERLRDKLADAVQDLVQPVQHEEPYTVWVNRNRQRRVHVTVHPCLLDQLAVAVDPGEYHAWPDTDRHGRRVPGSTPTVRLSVVDWQQRVTRDTITWYRRLGATPRPNLAAAVSGLVGLSQRAGLPDLAHLVHDVRRWRAWAKLLTGWTTPPWSPRVPCPACGQLGMLRVWLDRAVAGCGHDECRAWWDDRSISVLAEYIRTTTATDNQQPQEATPRI